MDTTLKEECPTLDVSKARLVYLDIDGVLNSEKTALLAGGWPGTVVDHEADTGYFGGGPRSVTLKDPYVSKIEAIDKYAVGLLNKLLVATNAHIVLTSTWRIGIDIYDIRRMLYVMGIDFKRIIGKTQDISPGNDRGEQIFNFQQGIKEKRFYSGPDFFVSNGRLIQSLSKVPITVESYVIIDDVDEFLLDQRKNVVLTDDYNGLTLGDTLRAGSILTGKDFEKNHLIHGEGYQGRIMHVPDLM